MRMQPVSCKRHTFPPDVIQLAVWLYFRFTLSLRDVEEMLAQRGIEASYETVGCWTLKFGQFFAQNLRRSRPKPTGRWHLDEMVVKIRGERM
jgi:transposase-like protein